MIQRSIALFLILVGTGFSAVAQITLTAANMPSVGLTVVSREADSLWATRVNLGQAGANRTWNFANPTPAAGTSPYMVTYVAPAGTPYVSKFAQANLASRDNDATDPNFSYFQSSNTQFNVMGNASKEVNTTFTPPIVGFRFPATYQTKFVSTTTGVLPDVLGQGLSGTIIDSVEIDAWGMVTTPLGTFNCLRVRRTQTGNLRAGGLIEVKQRGVTHEWWTAQYKAPVFSHTVNNITVPLLSQTLTFLSSEYLTNTTSSAKDFENLPAQMAFAPNPAVDYTALNIRLENAEQGDLFVYNLSGQLVHQANGLSLGSGDNRYDMSVAALVPGTYMALLTQGNRVLGMQQVVVAR